MDKYKVEIDWKRIMKADVEIMEIFMSISKEERIILRSLLDDGFVKDIVGDHIAHIGVMDKKEQVEQIKKNVLGGKSSP